MYPYLEQFGEDDLSGSRIEEVYSNPAFGHFNEVNVLPLIYRENDYQCNILIFDNARAREETVRIYRVGGDSGRGRKHPIWRFEDINGGYIAEVRYGDARANALQRGFWTHTKNALPYFKSVTRGWIDYSHNLVLVELFAKALNATQAGHTQALMAIERDLLAIKEAEGIV